MRNKKIKIIVGILILVAVGAFLQYRIKRSKPSAEIIREIRPTRGTIQNIISTTGTVLPRNRLEIKPPVNGRIEEILVQEGEDIKTGQTLARMSSTERAALLDAARGQGEETLKYWKEVYKEILLISPIDGEVIVAKTQAGQTVTISDPIIVLSDKLIVRAQVDETDIGKVKLNQSAIIGLDAYPKIKVKAKVDHISYESTIVNNVTIYEVDILPESVPEVFRSGMSASVDIIEVGKEGILVIPLEAVNRDKDGSFVLLRQDRSKRPVKQIVELGIFDETNIEVISGLTQEDKIIIKSEKYLPVKNTNSKSNPFMPFGRKRR